MLEEQIQYECLQHINECLSTLSTPILGNERMIFFFCFLSVYTFVGALCGAFLYAVTECSLGCKGDEKDEYEYNTYDHVFFHLFWCPLFT